jgi:uncharacterized protein with FMN-binding domain
MKPAPSPRTLAVIFGTGALAFPAISMASAAAATPTKVTKYTGKTATASQWGTVTVNVTQQTTGRGKTAARKFSDLGGGYTYHTPRSQFIMSQALPILRQEFLAAQNARIQSVSGATLTSEAFIQSLQSALAQAHA